MTNTIAWAVLQWSQKASSVKAALAPKWNKLLKPEIPRTATLVTPSGQQLCLSIRGADQPLRTLASELVMELL